jgi:branched-chain amino acid transport system permease protein
VSRILASPFGAVMEAIRENDKRAAACGYDVAAHQAAGVRAVGRRSAGWPAPARAAPVGGAHRLAALPASGHAVMMCLLGGMGTFFGPFVGAAVFLYLEDVVTNLTKHWMAVVGVIFMLFVLFFPRGIWGTLLHWIAGASASRKRRRRATSAPPSMPPPPPGRRQ